MIVDASVILRAFFPDEAQSEAHALIRDHVSGYIELRAPTLLTYEVANASHQAVRRGRVAAAMADEILSAFEGLQIALESVTWRQMLHYAQRFDRSAYDGAYLALAHARADEMITGDRRLYNAVHDELDWVRWIGDY